MYFGSFVIGIIFAIISFIMSSTLKRKFRKYSNTALMSGLSGREVALMMLRDHNIHDVEVLSVPGKLTDHYNPANKTVNLSPEVYSGRNAAAAAVAAHECGHAVQHATAYSMLQFRSAMVPIQNISNQVMSFLLMGMMFGFASTSNPFWIMIAVVCYGVFALFSFVTLPVEFDASNRALAWMSQAGIVTREEYKGSKDALFWAAMTYVVAALGALAQLMYWLMMMFAGGSDD